MTRTLLLTVLLAGGAAILSWAAENPELPAGLGQAPLTYDFFLRGEREKFGYAPSFYPGVVSFDRANRPYIRTDKDLITLDEQGQWQHLDFVTAVKQLYPGWSGDFRSGPFAEEHVVFDQADNAYLTLNVSRTVIKGNLLLFSPDHGRSWQAQPLTRADCTVQFEVALSHGRTEHPPAVLECRDNLDLYLYLPEVKNGELYLPEPIFIAHNVLLPPVHSGGASNVVSDGDLVHLAWASDEPLAEQSGTPQYVATYDRRTGKLGESKLLGCGGTGKPDNHNLPGLVLDSQGYLHVILGAHHNPMLYAHTLKPHDVYAGWTPLQPVGAAGQQSGLTYLGFMCGPDDTLHCVMRWSQIGYKFQLAYLRKRAGGEWEPTRVLVDPNRPMYGCWYHKLAFDRKGRLFCHYEPFCGQLSTDETAAQSFSWPQKKNFWYAGPGAYADAAQLMSADGGDTWHLATTADYLAGLSDQPAASAAPAPQAASTPRELKVPPLAQRGGSWRHLQAAGGLLFAAVGQGVQVYSLEKPEAPRWVAGSPFLDAEPSFLQYDPDRHRLYAACGRQGLLVLDASAPERGLTVVQRYTKIPFVKSLLRRDRLLVVAGERNGLFIFQTEPELRECGRLTGIEAHRLDLQGNLLFVAAAKGGALIVDLGDPTAPRLIGRTPPVAKSENEHLNEATNVAVRGDRLYMAPFSCGYHMRILDISDPAHPRDLANIKLPDQTGTWGQRPHFAGQYGIYALREGLRVLDFARPDAPQVVGQAATDAHLGETLLAGNYAYACIGNDPLNGLRVFKYDGQRGLTAVGGITSLATAWGIAVAGDQAYVTDWGRGVFQWNCASLALGAPTAEFAKPSTEQFTQIHSLFRTTVAGDGQIYTSTGTGLISLKRKGDQLVSIREWELESKITSLQASGLRDLAVLSTSAAAKADGRWTKMSGARQVVYAGGLLLASMPGGKLQMLFTGDNGYCLPAGEVVIGREVLGLATVGELALCGEMARLGRGGLSVWNLAEPAQPQLLGRLETDTDVWGVSVAGNLALAAEGRRGLELIDFSRPEAPVSRGRVATPFPIWQAAAAGDTVYAACGESGVATFSLSALQAAAVAEK